jgi:hypothetical protein
MKLSESTESVIESLKKNIPRLEAMLLEQKASGALKKDITETQRFRVLPKKNQEKPRTKTTKNNNVSKLYPSKNKQKQVLF